MVRTEYDRQASEFLEQHGMTMTATFAGWACPEFCDDDQHTHGARFEITLRRRDVGLPIPKLTFDFWGSHHDSHEQRHDRGHAKGTRLRDGGKRPTPYDVLACISGDIHTPDTFEDFCGEYGYEEDSRKAEATWKRCAEFAAKLRTFFPVECHDALTEIN